MLSLDEQVQAVYQILKDTHLESPWTKEQIQSDIISLQTDYYFVYDHGRAVGFLATQDLLGELEITNIAVLRAYQGKGYASQLIQFLEDDDLPIFLEVRESNLVAQALYRKFAFKQVGKRKDYYQNPREAALIMKREGKNDR
ncbi:ribosomal protein S18-alanine N-acetyltransferase [Streptococcus iniae]|uniref:ribosomal protein S18-alanine N-acetyltransferase n=1 Tax=Streptococcus iniae TaxID=1346 RepID=UPI002B2AF001|nr:ribosomal protein S18-alanine N-acetyltransferase [Streptococcus iniae]WNZ94090.1 ribosomal protein S18-alanine N-acetyltransferase [Streptococcus iniae]WNZ95849.1 ribosomal protein S18-alanine N-acetyltransferase [Streptococcus iniae]WNZ97046.1 ribosomal protein S18-alanine N-acetyltransferase [Streptococcus iniae]